ncbi:putative Kinase [Quillaja saponaria]|uniref:non-specific serine/threonine protein kinase n=1 Tax=Quillaja saponaria TaxID=32244 RepID=A0AAD7QI05_QUISA|nr:putative Kinase [Quillaja saponaria]
MKMIMANFFRFLLLASFLIAFSFTGFALPTLLPDDEVQALQDIAKTLEKKDWDFNIDPCSEQPPWFSANPQKGFENAVTCNCTFANSTVCHVVSIKLKRQSLPGTLPPEFLRLPYLQEIDLTRNYLNGTIPREWGSMNLVNLSLLGNRISGSIPEGLANITSLKSLVIEHNQFSGNLPRGLGNLTQIERLFLSSNNFTGEIPSTFERLTSLKDFRIADNHFFGKIPDFIQHWTNLISLVIQASGLSGPIPSGISFLVKVTDLRISDLNGTDMAFPPLNNMTNLKTLILRSCNIIGPLPEYLRNLTNLTTLDISFNKLSGGIPSNFSSLRKVDHQYLTGNQLTGLVPDWILQDADNVDLSYNNFNYSRTLNCQQRSVNLFASSLKDNNFGTVSCLRSFQCPKTWYSVRVNCGGRDVTVNGSKTFDGDTDPAGPAKFFQSSTNWAFSSTGHFIDDDRPSDSYIWTNSSRLSITNSELYMNARISPISLSYYGFCLGNGIYTVNLHFAEIMFTDDKTYSSVGRRVFDIYIQGKRELEDFNIAYEAGGVGKEVVRRFAAVVTNNTLEIRLYWAGKGTTSIPDEGVYGPLISAISVDSDTKPPSGGGNSISAGAVVAIVAAGAFVVILLMVILWWRGCLGRKSALERELKGLDLQAASFTLRQIKAATNNFDVANKIGEGGFGPVYKGFFSDGTIIAVKQLSSKSKQGNREFINEIGLISALQHPHLVKLYGCCVEGDQLLLVYEYMQNNSLARVLFGPEESQLKLNWPTRHKICVGIARGLAYLHEESRLKIVHRDIKATNVLLDEDLNPKISDFGLAKLDEEDNTHISTRIAGTYGYMAPEYAMHGYLTDKADVYSFGIVALEIVSGRSNTTHRSNEESFYLLDWARLLKEKGSILELVDPRLGSDLIKEEAMVMINVALLCANASQALRPTMSSVVSMLEGNTAVREVVLDTSELVDEKKLESMRKYYLQKVENDNDENENETRSLTIDGPWTGSSTSAPDLYPINLDSDYWEKRV